MNSTFFQYRFPAAIPGQLNFISFKNSLQECCQKQQLPVPAYKSWKFSYGYAAKVEVAGNTFKSTGVQGDQKEAQQNAAYNALVGLGLIDSTVPFDVKTAAGTLYIIFSLQYFKHRKCTTRNFSCHNHQSSWILFAEWFFFAYINPSFY